MRSSSLPIALFATVWTAAASASELDDAATALISGLAIPSLERFDLGEDVAVVVDLDGDLSRVLAGLLLSRLSALGAESVLVIEPGPSDDARARDAGAEWLLAVRGETKESSLSLFAELRQIDLGIWSTPPEPGEGAILATAQHRTELSSSSIPKPVDPPVSPTGTDRARLEGPAIRIGSIEEPVLSMRACRLLDQETDHLLVLTPGALSVYSLFEGRLRGKVRHAIDRLPRHRMPAREPIGSIACNGATIAFGHSGLAGGHLLRASSSRKRLALAPAGELPGIPLAALPDGRWLLGESDAGTNRYRPELTAFTGAEAAKVTLSAPIFEAAALAGEAPDGWRLLAVSADYRLIRLGDGLTAAGELGPSGVGISAFLVDGRPHVITTSPTFDGGRDLLSLYGAGEASRPVPVDGLVYATAVGRLRGSALDLVAAARGHDRTDLYLLRLWEPK